MRSEFHVQRSLSIPVPSRSKPVRSHTPFENVGTSGKKCDICPSLNLSDLQLRAIELTIQGHKDSQTAQSSPLDGGRFGIEKPSMTQKRGFAQRKPLAQRDARLHNGTFRVGRATEMTLSSKEATATTLRSASGGGRGAVHRGGSWRIGKSGIRDCCLGERIALDPLLPSR
jgi:hypothetical protein